MTALLVAAALAIFITELSKDRHVYDCTLCDYGVIWKGECWSHVGSELAPDRNGWLHPAIPKH